MATDPLDDILARVRAALSPEIDPAKQLIRAQVRKSLLGVTSEPTTVGRFTIVETIGRGGTGAVYAAYDPVLERDVALKLLVAADEPGRDRVIREARALARLNHPNIVAVYDVGSIADVVYIAMELVVGTNARAWVHDGRPSYRQVVRAFAEAGRGLAAAHAAAIVHGDVKPDNIVIGSDGRTRVIDFGRGGTPGYMAPEQLAGVVADARSDQFGFCVALYEALFGERPFDGNDPTCEVRPPPRHTRVPAWLRRIVERGLAVDPDRRHPSMDALVVALIADDRARRRRWLVGAGVLVAGTIGGLVFAPRQSPPSCNADARLGDAWSPARRVSVVTTLAAVHLEQLSLVSRLDDYAAAWRAGYTDACRATHERGEQSATLLDLRVHCLDVRRAALDALTTSLAADRDAATVELAAEAAWKLPELATCADTEALATGIPLPRSGPERARLDALNAAIAGARARFDTGLYREGRELAEVLLPQLQGVHPATRTAALDLIGDVRRAAGDWKREEAVRRDQVRAASASRDSRAVALAWLELAETVAQDPTRLVAANELADAAEAALAWSGPDEQIAAQILMFRGQRARDANDNAAARTYFERALAVRERVRGPDHPDVAMVLTLLGSLDSAVGRPADGLARHSRALAIRERAFGPDHPDTARTLTNLGMTARAVGDYDRAERALERAIAIFERRVGVDDYNLAYALLGLGNTFAARGKHAEALTRYERALVIWTTAVHVPSREIGILRQSRAHSLAALGQFDRARAEYERALSELRVAYGPDDPVVLGCLDNFANMLANHGDLATARGYQEQVLAALDRTAPDHPHTGVAAQNLAETYRELGLIARAMPLYRRAVAIQEKALGAAHPDVAFALTALGNAAQASGDQMTARDAFERALAILNSTKAEPSAIGFVQLGLAKARWATGDQARARTLADQAKATFATAGEAAKGDLLEATRWRATH